MTITTTEATQQTPRERALDLLRGETLATVLEADGPLRTVDLARKLATRLDLKFNEAEAGGLASVVRMLLDSDPLFSQANRQWDLALRMGRAEGDRRKPVESAIEDFIDLFGRPVPPRRIAVLLAAVYGRTEEHYLELIDRLAATGRTMLHVGDRLAARRWLLEVTSDDVEDVEWDNFEDLTTLDPFRSAAGEARGETAQAYAFSLVEKAPAPVPNKELQFFIWQRFPDEDPEELFQKLLESSEIQLVRGACWVTEADRRKDLEAVLELVRDPDSAGELVVSTMPDEEEGIGMLGQTTVRVTPEDINQVHAFLKNSPGSHRVSEILQQVLEAFPGSRTYADMEQGVTAALRTDDRFRWVGWDRFRLSDSLPGEIESVPEGLAFDDMDYFHEDGETVDRAMSPDEWKGSLIDQVEHPLVQGMGDDVSQPGPAPARLVVSLPLHHYVAGTAYVRKADRRFFPEDPDLLELTLIAPDDTEHTAWFNGRLGIIYGLKQWYEENLPWVGARFELQPAEAPGAYRLVYSGETEPLMDLPMERLQQLIQLRSDAEGEALPLTEIVRRILEGHEEPIDFVTLFTEINIVRRTRRAAVASVLSGLRYYSQSGDSLWRYDERRAQKAQKKKGGKRPKREYYEDEEEAIEPEL